MARINRIKTDGEAYYHVVTRIANRAFLLGDAERKRRVLDMLRRAADFSGVGVVTYTVMDNHLHLCVHVPERARRGGARRRLRQKGSVPRWRGIVGPVPGGGRMPGQAAVERGGCGESQLRGGDGRLVRRALPAGEAAYLGVRQRRNGPLRDAWAAFGAEGGVIGVHRTAAICGYGPSRRNLRLLKEEFQLP